MKNIKKLLALVLVLAICAAFALPALATETEPKPDVAGEAASDGPFTLTMTNPQKDHRYVVYQLFSGNPAKDGDDWVLGNVEYGSSGWKFISDDLKTEANPEGIKDAKVVAKELAAYTTGQQLKDFVNALPYNEMTIVSGSEQEADKTITNADGETVAAPLTWSLPGGYYVIKDITTLSAGSEEVISGIMVRVVGPVDVNIKPTKPEPGKDIENTTPEVVGPHDYAVGDMIPYVLSAKVPVADLGSYVKPGTDASKSTYNLTFRDYMPDQLTYLPSKANFKVYYNTGTRTEIDNSKYSVINNPNADNNGKKPTFEVSLDLFEVIGTDPSGWTPYVKDGYIVIEVTYYAMLNAVNVVETGIENQVTLVYPNNPYDNTQEGSSVSPPVKVPVYTFTLDGTKVDSTDITKKLSGAVFELYEEVKKDDGSTEDRLIEFVEDNGQFIRWSDTAYSKKQIEGEGENAKTYVNKVIGEDSGNPVYEMDGTSPKKYYVVTSVTSAEETGKFAFGGLAAGTYKLHETKAPAGYNILENDITIVITAEYNKETKEVVVKHTVDGGSEKDGTAIEVQNSMGSKLPSTGGIGTTIFYAVGAVLVIGAGVLLFTKKRMHG